jgi:hypothetical protein
MESIKYLKLAEEEVLSRTLFKVFDSDVITRYGDRFYLPSLVLYTSENHRRMAKIRQAN